MTVLINKPAFNLREALTSLKRKIGLKGSEIMAAETVNDVYNVIGTNRNKIINGAMVIDQRNAGAAVTGGQAYPVDRFFHQHSVGTLTSQQVSDAPYGFTKSIKITTTTSGSPGTYDYARLQYRIEGSDVKEINAGTQYAKPFTFSFWVKASIAGKYGVGFGMGSSSSAYYTASYDVKSPNVWQYVSFTVPGQTLYSTFTDSTGIGILVGFDLGEGTGRSATAGSWNTVGQGTFGLLNGVKMVTVTDATFQVTGVQLEVGSVATPFEHRPYATELALCQRYFHRISGSPVRVGVGGFSNSSNAYVIVNLPVSMRSVPSMSVPSAGAVVRDGIAWYAVTSASLTAESSRNAIGVSLSFNSTAASQGDSTMWGGQTEGAIDMQLSAEL